MDDERKEFEAWFVSKIPSDVKNDALLALRKSEREDGNYRQPVMQAFWEGWLARAASSTSPTKSGQKMVAVCCGRSECGGECGNEWQGMRPSSPAQSEKVAGKGWKALHAAADAVAASADVWEGFSTQDAKVCVDAYLAYAAPRPEGMDD